MKLFISLFLCSVCLLQSKPGFAQQLKFNKVIDGNADRGWSVIGDLVQDKQGFLWFTTAENGFYQYNGSGFKAFTHNAADSNSLADNNLYGLAIDTSGNIWIGTNSGLDKYNPVTKTFTHFRHDPKDSSSLISNEIVTILADHLDNIWIGTLEGLDRLNITTEKITHYLHSEEDLNSLSWDCIHRLYEDREGTIWVGCYDFTGYTVATSGNGGLNSFNSATGKFTRYKHNAADSSSIADNNITALFEDSKGNFWVGTGGNGLHIMNRATGKFAHFFYDPAHPENLSRPPLKLGSIYHIITVIAEDNKGGIWIGGSQEGVNRYDPVLKRVVHYGHIIQKDTVIKDNVSGFDEPGSNAPVSAVTTKDGLFWLGTSDGNLYNINFTGSTFPYNNIEANARSFSEESDSVMYIATTEKGLLKLNRKTGIYEKFAKKFSNQNNLPKQVINTLRKDPYGNLWIGTGSGLYKWETGTNLLTRYAHDSSENNSVYCLHADKKNVWAGFKTEGLDKLDLRTGSIIHYLHNAEDSNSISSNSLICIGEDKVGNVWIGTNNGLDKLNQKNNSITHYLQGQTVYAICIDHSGSIWAGTVYGLYQYNTAKDEYTIFQLHDLPGAIQNVEKIAEDKENSLWVSTSNQI